MVRLQLRQWLYLTFRLCPVLLPPLMLLPMPRNLKWLVLLPWLRLWLQLQLGVMGVAFVGGPQRCVARGARGVFLACPPPVDG
mmetsp:Transcript_13931/g.44672  ORF Transcript_13931/g.44672 Transcript_13931/m.44672 type:complete len:83 (-) Transcript_13931:969-1217(-)